MRYYFQYLRTYLIIKRKQLKNAFSLTKGYHYTPFVILCEPRTGSTWLHTYLNSHSDILSLGEILRMGLEKGLTTEDLINGKIFKSFAKGISAVGFKLFYSYSENPDYKNAFDQIIKRKEVKIIHLIRKNLLELYVSRKIAEQTNVWSSSQKTTEMIRIQVDIEDYLRFVKIHRERKHKINDLFREHQILLVTYEELVEHTNRTLTNIQNFLGVQPQELFSLLVKQNEAPVESRISNYSQIEEQLSNYREEL